MEAIEKKILKEICERLVTKTQLQRTILYNEEDLLNHLNVVLEIVSETVDKLNILIESDEKRKRVKGKTNTKVNT